MEAFFQPAGGMFVPRPHARSPWAADMLHGRLLAGLAARQVELDHTDGGLRVVRVTADLFRVAPMAGVVVTASRARDGRRVRAVDVTLTCEGVDVARVSALLLASSGEPSGRVWSAPAWRVPDPSTLPPPVRTESAEAMGAPDMRMIDHPLDGPGPYRAWLREPWGLVDAEPLTPLVRAVMAADVANPLSNWGEDGLSYINADLTVYLARPPGGEWIGLEVTDHVDHGGVAVGQCRLHDREGPIGHTEVSAIVRAFGTGR